MKQSALVVWAVSATAVAVAAVGGLGYLMGQRLSHQSASTIPVAAQGVPMTDPSRPAEARAPAYTVPEEFSDAPTQWRTEVGSKPAAYAALFDPSRRELIVEHCKHPGYDVEGGRNLVQDGEVCARVLTARLASLTREQAVALDRDGQRVDVRIDASLAEQTPSLRLRFGDHDVDMVPGTRNDMFQALERIPAIATQKEKYMQALITKNAAARAARRERTETANNENQ